MPPLLPSDFSGKILVVRRDNIGDLVCTTPLFAALKQTWPRAHCAALVNSYNAPVLFGNPHLDAVHVYTKFKHRGPGQGALAWIAARLRLIRMLRREHFDIAILARPASDPHGLNFVRLLGIQRIVGFAPAAGAAPPALTMPIPLPDKGQQHEVQSVWALANAIGITVPPGPLQVFPATDALAEKQARLGEERPIIAVHISAREVSRRLSVEKWQRALAGVHARLPLAQLAIFWSPGPANDPRHPGDDEKAVELFRVAAALPLIPMPTGTLPELVSALAACDYFIGADGGALHVAAALGLPTAALFENLPFKIRHWHPWQVAHRMVVSPTMPIGDIEPDEIVNAFLALVQDTRKG